MIRYLAAGALYGLAWFAAGCAVAAGWAALRGKCNRAAATAAAAAFAAAAAGLAWAGTAIR